jgi:hypothetical protein
MKRYAISLVLTAILGLPAFGQPPLAFGPPPPTPHQAVLPGPIPTPPPTAPIASSGYEGFYKSGSVIVGRNGYFPYDTGVYLLGGTDGLARSIGFYTMMPTASMGPPPMAAAGPTVSGSCGSRCRLFHR